MIRIDALSKRFGQTLVLQDVDAEFLSGGVYGIVGENGAGKTTLFRCIAGLEAFEGTITCRLGSLRERLGYLPTEPWFFPRITGREYLRLLCKARHTDPGDLDRRNLFDLPLDRFATAYSTGMKKKLALTALLLQPNEVFILDEPFNGVDIQSNLVIAAIIKKLKEKGHTLIISSHIFSTLGESCDEILLLHNHHFEKHVQRGDFDRLEAEMVTRALDDRIARIGL